MKEILMIVIGGIVTYLTPKLLDPYFARQRQGAAIRGFPWPAWMVALAIAGGVGGALSAALGAMGIDTAGGWANWAAFGACLGIAQWLVLQKQEQLSALWPLASALGWSVFAFFGLTNGAASLASLPAWLSAGLAVGLLQWPLLSKVRRRAFWWVPANAVASLIGGALGFGAGLAMQDSGMPFASAWILAWSLVGLFGSLITGFALSRMPLKPTALPPGPNPSPGGQPA